MVPTKAQRAGVRQHTGDDPYRPSCQIVLGLLLHQLMKFFLYLLQVRKATLPRLGEDEAAIHCHLKATAAAGDQG